jgi:hypothetical protein
MNKILRPQVVLGCMALFVVFCGCESNRNSGRNLDIEYVDEWKVVDCPRCKGKGKIYIGDDHPLHEAGYPVGWLDCENCLGSGKMRTNGRGVYTRVKK